MTINYSVLPNGLVFDPATPTPVVVELYDPAYQPNRYLYKTGGTGPGSFSWDGRLYSYDGQDNIVGGPYYCQASKAFARIHIHAADLQINYVDGTITPMPNVLTFSNHGFALDLGNVWVTEGGVLRAELQAGLVFTVSWNAAGYHPNHFMLWIDRAFKPLNKLPADLPYNANDLIHPVGSYKEEWTYIPPLLYAVYETGSRASVSGTDLGLRQITLMGLEDETPIGTVTLDAHVVRDVTLTAYYTPYERNPAFIGDAPTYNLFSSVPVEVWTAGGVIQTIYVDETFRNAIAQPKAGGGFQGMEGYGKIFRWREFAWSPCDTQVAPPPEKAYLAWNASAHRFEFAARPLGGWDTELNVNSTARNMLSSLSYFNKQAGYRIPLLQYYGTLYMQGKSGYKALPPPDNRVVDDKGGKDDLAYWLDIYFAPENTDYGVSPAVVNGFRGSTWRQIMGNDPLYPADSIRARK